MKQISPEADIFWVARNTTHVYLTLSWHISLKMHWHWFACSLSLSTWPVTPSSWMEGFSPWPSSGSTWEKQVFERVCLLHGMPQGHWILLLKQMKGKEGGTIPSTEYRVCLKPSFSVSPAFPPLVSRLTTCYVIRRRIYLFPSFNIVFSFIFSEKEKAKLTMDVSEACRMP